MRNEKSRSFFSLSPGLEAVHENFGHYLFVFFVSEPQGCFLVFRNVNYFFPPPSLNKRNVLDVEFREG